jgi:hypothetical protein
MNFFGEDDNEDIIEHSHIEHEDPTHKEAEDFHKRIEQDKQTVKIERQCLTSKNGSGKVKENKENKENHG